MLDSWFPPSLLQRTKASEGVEKTVCQEEEDAGRRTREPTPWQAGETVTKSSAPKITTLHIHYVICAGTWALINHCKWLGAWVSGSSTHTDTASLAVMQELRTRYLHFISF